MEGTLRTLPDYANRFLRLAERARNEDPELAKEWERLAIDYFRKHLDPLPSSPIQNKQKVLFLSANPRGTPKLDLDRELRAMRDVLGASRLRDQYELEIEPAVRLDVIMRTLLRHQPAIVHFAGHGSGVDGLQIEDESGKVVFFPTNDLDRLFALFKGKTHCVVLNACFSQEQAIPISRHNMYVVGMNRAIGDQSAVRFARGFFMGIWEGEAFDRSFELGLIRMSGHSAHQTTPELWYRGKKVK